MALNYLKKDKQVQVCSDGPVERYINQGWKVMSFDEYEKWADASWKKEKARLNQLYNHQADQAEDQGKLKEARELREKAARFADQPKAKAKA